MVVRLLALVFVFAVGLPFTAARAEEPFVPSWIKNDPATKSVAVEIIADWNVVARYAKGNVRTDIMDFNGYWGGNLTLAVPTGWSVRIEFINHASMIRHSIMVTRTYAQSEMPIKSREEDALWGAYVEPNGIWPQHNAQLNFVAKQSGSYFLACPRELHLREGHWIGFEVRDGLEQAVAIVHEDKFPQGDPPGRL